MTVESAREAAWKAATPTGPSAVWLRTNAMTSLTVQRSIFASRDSNRAAIRVSKATNRASIATNRASTAANRELIASNREFKASNRKSRMGTVTSCVLTIAISIASASTSACSVGNLRITARKGRGQPTTVRRLLRRYQRPGVVGADGTGAGGAGASLPSFKLPVTKKSPLHIH